MVHLICVLPDLQVWTEQCTFLTGGMEGGGLSAASTVWVRGCASLEQTHPVSWPDGIRGTETRLLVLYWYS